MPKKNEAFIKYIGLPSVADDDIFKAAPTIAAGDFKVSKDGGSFANLATLPTVTPAGGEAVKLSLSATEMDANNVAIHCKDAAGTEWKSVFIDIPTTTNDIDDLATEAKQDIIDTNVDAILVDTGTTIPATITTLDTNVDAILVDTGTTLPATLATIDGIVDTILVDTDELQTNQGAWATATGFSTHAAADVWSVGTRILTAGTNILNSTALSNIEKQYDTTGLTGDTFPSSQAQLSAITNVGSAINTPAVSYSLTTGVQSANTYASTEALDGTRHEHTDDGGAMELYYEFTVGAGTPSSVTVTGYLSSANDSLNVFGYDWVSTSWKQIGIMAGKGSATNDVNNYDLFVNMVGTGANKGKIRVRFLAASGLTSATLAIDQIYTAFSQGTEGYDRASIWYNSAASNTGTIVGVDGTAGNPVSTEAAVQTLLVSTGYKAITNIPGSTYVMADAHDGLIIYNHGGTLELGGQSINETHIFDGEVSGISTSATDADFHDAFVGAISIQNAHLFDCTMEDTVTLTDAGDYSIVNCQSGVAGDGAPTLDMGAAIGASTVSFRRWSGGITINNLAAGDVVTVSGELGTVTLNGADAQVEIRGTYKALVNNLTGSPTVNVDGAILAADVAAILVDTSTTLPARFDGVEGATFNTSTDSLEAIRDRGDAAWTTGAGGSAPTVVEIREEMDANSTQLAAIVGDTNELQTNQGNWITATGFSTHAATDIVSAGAITTLSGAVVNVDLVDVTTTNTDMISASPTAIENADALLNRDLSAVSDTNSRSPLNALRFLRNKWSLSGTTLTVTKEDDATSAWTATVTTDAAADPITGNDPT